MSGTLPLCVLWSAILIGYLLGWTCLFPHQLVQCLRFTNKSGVMDFTASVLVWLWIGATGIALLGCVLL